MRNYNSYKKELFLEHYTEESYTKNDIKKIQEWLWLNNKINKYSSLNFSYNSTFDEITKNNVKKFQASHSIPITGIVDAVTYKLLVKPLENAFKIEKIEHSSFRELVCKIAQLHLDNYSSEIFIDINNNQGPWVRSYCKGKEGLKWCLGFVNCVFDIACDISKKNINDFLIDSLDCDSAVQFAKEKDKFMKFEKIDISKIKPGDLFFTYSTLPGDFWVHTGIITKIIDHEYYECIEGNSSNTEGVGIRVEKKIRKFKEIINVNNDDTPHLLYNEFYLLNI